MLIKSIFYNILNRKIIYFVPLLVVITQACKPTSGEGNTNNKKVPEQIKDKIIIGMNPAERSQNVQNNAKVLAKLIEDKIHIPVEIFVSTDYSGLVEALHGGNIDFAFMAPVPFVFAENIADAKVLLKAERNGQPFYYGAIIVRANSNIKTLYDLKGKNIAWVDPQSASGHIFPKWALMQNGFSPEQFFSQQIFAGGHDAVLLSVANGTIEAGATYCNDKEGIEGAWTMIADGKFRNELKSIFVTPPIPGDNFVTYKGFLEKYPNLVSKVTQAIQGISHDSIGKNTIKKLYHVDGMIPAKSEDYEVVRQAAKTLKLDITGKIADNMADNKLNYILTNSAFLLCGLFIISLFLSEPIKKYFNKADTKFDNNHKFKNPVTGIKAGQIDNDSSSEILYEFENLYFKVDTNNGEKTILSNINTKIFKGEFVAIIGLSGSGKTSFLRCLNGFNKPTSGYLYFENKNILSLKKQELEKIRKKIAYIFQHFNLVKNYSAYQNVLLSRYPKNGLIKGLLGVSNKTDKLICRNALLNVGLEKNVNQKVSSLSGGQQQRVAIARAMAQEPTVILADEPMASLDPKLSVVVLETLNKLNKENGVTVVVNIHVLELSKRFASRIIAMQEGRIVFDGKPENLTDEIISNIYSL